MSTPSIEIRPIKKTARITGIWYLLMAISGVLGFMVLHSQIFVKNDPEQTLLNLINEASTGRFRLILEFAIVVTQALTAVWFYKLFRKINEWAAWTLGVWGMINSMAIMISAIAMATAINIATSEIPIMEEKIILIQLLQNTMSNAWSVGGLFFGLWLFPMGYIVITSKCMPLWLGRVIIIGGIAYLLNTIVRYTGIELPFKRLLLLPASIGEFWMIGYLLLYGIREKKERVSN